MSNDKSVVNIDDAVSSPRAEAARRNGAKSRGPTTEEGKLRSSQNSLKHGMHARTIILPGESQEEYDQLRDEYLEQFVPAGPAERHEVETLYNAEWRIQRMRRMEVAHVKYRIDRGNQKDKDLAIAIGYQDEINGCGSGGVACVYHFEPKLQRDYDRALRRLLDLQKRRANASPPPPNIENHQNEPKPLTPTGGAGGAPPPPDIENRQNEPKPLTTDKLRLTTDHRPL